MDRAALEARLAAFPIYAYAFFTPDQLVFSERVRTICRTQCPMYDKSWACPPAVGTVAACRERLLRFQRGLMIATVAEVPDIADMPRALQTRGPPERLTRRVLALVRHQAGEATALSTEACALCKQCAWPGAACRHPERMFPCVESHGILVTDLAEKCGVDFMAGGNLITWFSLIFYNEFPSGSEGGRGHEA